MPTQPTRPPRILLTVACVLLALGLVFARAQTTPAQPLETRIITTWYKLTLELVRHTPTATPPVTSRAFGYLGVTLHEAIASRSKTARSLVGQLNGLSAIPQPENAPYDDAAVIHAALTTAVRSLYANTGPTGQRALDFLEARLSKEVAARGVAADVLERSQKYGQSVANAVLEWSKTDGGAEIINMGFPLTYPKAQNKAEWVPTSAITQQQTPLLPNWGQNRPFALKSGDECKLPAPPEYSEDKNSAFYREALEVYETTRKLTNEQKAIARFWSDDPMLSPTPPGHWISIFSQMLEAKPMPLETVAEGYARLGIALADSFIGCWHTKYQYKLLRPITYIRRLIDPKWETLLTTPPFPEYPSGHSTQSAAAAEVLTAMFGEKYAFEDRTHEADNIPGRKYASFRDAAKEAAISRLYGGIHYRSGIERGLDQGKCIGAKAVALRFKR